MTPLAPSQTSDDYIQARWDFHKDKTISQSGKHRFNSKLRRSLFFYHYTAYQQCITVLKMEWNEIKWHHFPVTKQIWTQLYVGKYLSTKPSFQTFFSEIQHSFPAQIAISFEIKIGLALDICHFFLKQHIFCSKLHLTDKKFTPS